MDLNLDTLKREILDYLESRDLAVFRSTPGTLEDPQMVLWDSEHYPDYRMFLDAAIKTDFLKPSDAMRLLSDYERLLQEYTYLSLNGTKPPPQPGNWLPLRTVTLPPFPGTAATDLNGDGKVT